MPDLQRQGTPFERLGFDQKFRERLPCASSPSWKLDRHKVLPGGHAVRIAPVRPILLTNMLPLKDQKILRKCDATQALHSTTIFEGKTPNFDSTITHLNRPIGDRNQILVTISWTGGRMAIDRNVIPRFSGSQVICTQNKRLISSTASAASSNRSLASLFLTPLVKLKRTLTPRRLGGVELGRKVRVAAHSSLPTHKTIPIQAQFQQSSCTTNKKGAALLASMVVKSGQPTPILRADLPLIPRHIHSHPIVLVATY